MRTIVTSAVVIFLGLSSCFAADDLLLNPCKVGDLEVVQEFSPKYASSNFGNIHQDIFALGYSRSHCMSNAPGRWQFEGQLSGVNEDGRKSKALLAGLGFSWPLMRTPSGFSLDVNPMLRLGYESATNTRVGVSGFGSSLAFDKVITKAEDGYTGLVLFGNLGYEYSARRFLYDSSFGTNFSNSQRANSVTAGLDQLFGQNQLWRVRASVSNQYLSGAGSSGSIRTAAISLRPVSGLNDDYPWYVELSVSKGFNQYSSVLVSVNWRDVTKSTKPKVQP